MKAWITYTFQDKDLVDKLTKILVSSNIEVLNETSEIKPGDNIIETIYNILSSADIFFIVLSKNSNQGKWQNAEIGMIVSEIRNNPHKKIIPVLTKSGIKIPPFIDQYQYMILENREDLNVKFAKFIGALKLHSANDEYHNYEKIYHDITGSMDKLLKNEKIMYEQVQKRKNKILHLVLIANFITNFLFLLVFMLVGRDFLFKDIDNGTFHDLMVVTSLLTTGVCVSLIIFKFLKKRYGWKSECN